MTRRNAKRSAAALLATLALLGGALASAVDAKPGYLARAQQLGYPARDCAYCHTEAWGGDAWNARGRWLRTEKKKRKAADVDVEWLKRYRGK